MTINLKVIKEINYTNLEMYTHDKGIKEIIDSIHNENNKKNKKSKNSSNYDYLDSLLIESTISSNNIEGISTSKERLNQLMKKQTKPYDKSEQEILGYKEALKHIYNNHQSISLSITSIKQIHATIYSYTEQTNAGRFKLIPNRITEITSDGDEFIRFVPVHPSEVSKYMDDICEKYKVATKNKEINPLILIACFTLDFLCIHPFQDGNGRTSRLLMILLLYHSGYDIVKYVSLEKEIELSKKEYYESLYSSSQNWRDNKNDYKPFIIYFLKIILQMYQKHN